MPYVCRCKSLSIITVPLPENKNQLVPYPFSKAELPKIRSQRRHLLDGGRTARCKEVQASTGVDSRHSGRGLTRTARNGRRCRADGAASRESLRAPSEHRSLPGIGADSLGDSGSHDSRRDMMLRCRADGFRIDLSTSIRDEFPELDRSFCS